jgi:phenylacetate-CoA ligase
MADRHPTRSEIEALQWDRLRHLLARVVDSNPFYREKWKSAFSQPLSIEDFSLRFPFTTKAEAVADQAAHPPFGTNLTSPVSAYTRFHQTSGTTGNPLRWLDTPASWAALVDNWVRIYDAAGVAAGDRVYFAFSFGPFIGFWLAFDAAQKIGALCIPGGGLGSAGRLRAILDTGVTILCCTPTYALRLAEVARQEGVDLTRSNLRRIIVAGEPGGSVPAVRERIESAWPGARVFDHHGMTEVGPVSYECPVNPGRLHIIDSAYLAEVINPATLLPAAPGESGELILTTLTRVDSPLIRYRTGDLVRLRSEADPCCCGRSETALEGGILGRADDMLVVRGINIFPAAIDALLSQFPEIAEFQVKVLRRESMTELEILVEPGEGIVGNPADLLRRVESLLHASLHLRIPVSLAPDGSLPRFEMKARRWVFA